MNKKVIIINGTGGSGKDTFVSFCSKFAKVTNVSSIDKAKEAAHILVGWNGEKDEKSRKLLVDLKQLSIDYNDAPTNYINKEYKKFLESDSEYLFIHIREIDEIEKAKKNYNAKTLLITNPRVALITSNNSDGNVYNYSYDYIIKNEGTLEELANKAKKFLQESKWFILEQKIGFFGGSFNPPSNVHINIAKELLKEQILDKVIFVPVGDYYEKRELVLASHRYNMLNIFLNGNSNLSVEDILINSKDKLYATDAFKLILNKYKNEKTKIYFIMGSDNFKKIHTWKNYEDFITKYNFIVIERTENKINCNFENVISFSTKQKSNIDSTTLRTMLQEGKDIKEYIPKDVIDYIKYNKLYNKFND